MPPTIIRIDNIPEDEIVKSMPKMHHYFYQTQGLNKGIRLTLWNRAKGYTYEVLNFRCSVKSLWSSEEELYMTLWTKKKKPRISQASCGFSIYRRLYKKVEEMILHEGYQIIYPDTNLQLYVNTVNISYSKDKRYNNPKVDLILTTSKEDDQVILSRLEENIIVTADTEESYLKKMSEEDFFLIGPLL